MSAIDPTPSPVPQRLEEPLRIVAGRARLLAWFHAFFKLAALCAIVWLLVVLTLGSRLQIPTWASIPVALVGWAVVIYGAFHILRDLFRRPRGLASAARLADAALPESQERLSSAIEIAQEKNPAFRGSPELVAVLMRQAEHHADNMDPGQIISGKQVMRWLSAAGTTLFIWFILLVILTPNMLLGLQRMFQPWTASDAPPPPIVEVLPGDHVYAQGADVEIAVNVKPPDGLSFDTGNGAIAAATLFQHFLSANGGRTPDISLPMDRVADVASNRAFRLKFYNVQQSFTYKILVDGGKNIGRGESPSYTITVETRPAVADVEVLYTFPKYTALNPRTEHSREGTLEALTGTKARLTIHATEPVQTAQLLIGDDGSAAITTVNLTPIAPPTTTAPTELATRETPYTAEITIDRSTQYHIKLVKADGRDNLDNQARTIRAKPDTPPTILITQPDSKSATQIVRPDDTVPLKFLATDDFGITKIEALIQIDQRAEQSFDIPITPDTRIPGDWSLDLSTLLKYLPAQPEPRQITYQFRATDNRDPNPQTALSSKQTLTLDKSATSHTQRLDTQAAKNLADAAAKAAAKLQDAQTKLDELQKSDRAATLSDGNRQKVSEIQQDLSQAGQLLRQAADQSGDSRLSALARQLRDVADQPIKRAEEDIIKTGLATDQPTARQDSQTSAARNTQDALNQLKQLANTVQNTAKEQPLAQALENLAKEQQALADALAQKPNDPKLLERQRELQSQLDKLIKDNPQLQKPAAGAHQPRVDDLIRKLRDLEQAQQPINDQLDNIKNAATASDQSAALAKEQQKLNEDINNFNYQNAESLRQAGAKTPDSTKLDPIVKQLQDNKPAAAANDQKSAAAALDKTANDLKTAQAKAAANDPARQQAAKDIANANDLQQETQKLADDIRKAKESGNTSTKAADPANQDAKKLADKIKQAAQQISNRMPNNSPAKTAAQNAAKATDAAKIAAERGEADRAQQQLNDAANQLQQAAENEQLAANNGAASDPTAAKAAEQKARDLAAAQKALAEKSDALAKSQQNAANAKAAAPATAQKQRDLANRLDDAAKDAQSLQQQTQGPAPELADKAAQAAKALQQAADAQRQAAQSNNPADAANKQTQSADRLADADEALSGQRPQRPGNPSAQSPNQNSNQNPDQTPDHNLAQNSTPQNPAAAQSVQAARNSQAQALKGDPKSAQGAAEQLSQASRQLMNNPPAQPGANPNQPNANSGQPQPTPPSSGQVASSAPSPNPSAAPPASSQPGSAIGRGKPGSDQSPSGKPNGQTAPGSTASGQPTPGQPIAGQPGNGQPTAGQPGAGQPSGGQPTAAQPAAGQPIAGQPGPGQPTSGQPGPAQPGPGQPGTGQPPAAQPGAGQPMAGQPGPGQPGPGASASGQPTSGQPATGQPRSGQSAQGTPSPGTPGSGGGGKILSTNGRDTLIPQQAQDTGIAPSDWIKLSPELQDQLLHAQQQPGPPEYRDMIKDYYTRLARMQSQSPTPPAPGANP